MKPIGLPKRAFPHAAAFLGVGRSQKDKSLSLIRIFHLCPVFTALLAPPLAAVSAALLATRIVALQPTASGATPLR